MLKNFNLWYWRRLLRVPWIARGSNQSNLKEINPEYSLEGLMVKLKLQYFGADEKSWLMEKTLILGKIEGTKRKVWQRWLDDITDSMDMSLRQLWEIVKNREAWHAAVHVAVKNQTWLSNWMTVWWNILPVIFPRYNYFYKAQFSRLLNSEDKIFHLV